MNHVFSTDINIILLLCKPKELKEVSLNNIFQQNPENICMKAIPRTTEELIQRTRARTHALI